MKSFILIVVALFATIVAAEKTVEPDFVEAAGSAELPVATELPEIPAKYCGTYYLHKQTVPDVGWKGEDFSPAKPFARIEAKRIILDGGKTLKITRITKLVAKGLSDGQPIYNVQFEKADFGWGIKEAPDAKLTIIQTSPEPYMHLDKMQATIFLVSQKQ